MSDENVVRLTASRKTAKKAEKCPICAKKTIPTYKPFCSKRCADIDLGAWLGEGYRLPSDEVPGFDGDYDED